MTKEELLKVGKSLGLIVAHSCEEFVSFEGINGYISIFYASHPNNMVVSTMKNFTEHIKMMGRDELRMEINSLLSIIRHG